MEKEYGQNCWDITLELFWSNFDWFSLSHYLGWTANTLIASHYGICWSASIMWEITEMSFGHLLPILDDECWWDNIVLDVFVCNGLGIFTGMQICRWFEMKEHHWESIAHIETKKGKIKQALLQLTPDSFHSICFLDPECIWRGIVAFFPFVFIIQIGQLNIFFLNDFFPMPAAHPISMARMAIHLVIGAPAARQYYSYVTDKSCKRVGTQLWIYLFVTFSEVLLNVKFGSKLVSQIQISKMVLWLLLNIVISIIGFEISIKIYRWRYHWSDILMKDPQSDIIMNKIKTT
jgi:phosphatidylserine synthase 1